MHFSDPNKLNPMFALGSTSSSSLELYKRTNDKVTLPPPPRTNSQLVSYRRYTVMMKKLVTLAIFHLHMCCDISISLF